MKFGLIAGGGRFPLLVLSSAKRQGHEIVAVAVKEEADPQLEQLADRCYWISLGQLSKLIKIFHQEQITEAVMAGRVRHARIFSSIRPDLKLLKLLSSLPRKNTDSLIGAVANVLAEEGIQLLDSTKFLEPDLAKEGPLTKRVPSGDELADIEYGREIASALVAYDIGQTVVICERACVAVEAMEGTNDVILRAGQFSNGRPLTVVKMAKPDQDMRFDVPVIGPTTIEKMQEVNGTALAIEAGKTLFLDREETLRAANEAEIAVVGY
jgi:DUF1009 family protein